MRAIIYTLLYIGRKKKLGMVCFIPFMIGLFLQVCVCGNEPVEDYHDLLIFIIPAIPLLFFIAWFIFALIVLGIEKFIIAPIEFVVYKLGIPKIKINVNVIWKYQQNN